MERLKFLTAGVPISSMDNTTESGLRRLVELGLDGMELEFVRNVFLKEGTAEPVRESAAGKGLALTVHGSYFINLNAVEKDKAQASEERILKAARIGALAGAGSMTFHAAFYMKKDPGKVHARVRDALKRITRTLRDEGHMISVRPETTGKPSSYGSLTELLVLSQEVEGVGPCIDWAHMHARTGGTSMNSLSEFSSALDEVEKALGKEGLHDMHMHIAGIEYTPKGERRHLDLRDKGSDLRYEDVLRALKDHDVHGRLVCESPSIEKDARLLKDTFEKMRG